MLGHINGDDIDIVESVYNLGIKFNDKLTWPNNISSVVIRVYH